MNTSDYTIKQIRSILFQLIENGEGIIWYYDGTYSNNLCELVLTDDFFINSIEQEGTLLTINFEQYDSYEEEGWGSTYHFISIQEKETIEKYLNNLPVLIKKLNERQVAGKFHPQTCINYHNGDRTLIATPNGWICDKCDYTQEFSEHDLNILNKKFMG